MKKPTRRKLMEQTSVASLSVLTAASAQRILGANNRVRIGFIGDGNRGDQGLDSFLGHPDAQIISIAGVYQPYLPFAAHKAGGSPALHTRTTARFWTRRTWMLSWWPLRTIGVPCR